MRAVRALVVEDEAVARQNLRDYLQDVDWVTLAGEAADGKEAVRLASTLKPDLLFLDVRLPRSCASRPRATTPRCTPPPGPICSTSA